MGVVYIKAGAKRRRYHRAPSDLVDVDKSSGAGRFFFRMVRDIEGDLGGRRRLSRIERELIEAFCGSATALKYLTHQLLIGESADVLPNLSAYAQLSSTMLRIGMRLGLSRRQCDVTEMTLDDYLTERAEDAAGADDVDPSDQGMQP